MPFEDLEAAIAVNDRKSRIYSDYFRTRRTPRNTSIMAPPELRDDYFTSVPYCRLACQVLSERIEMDSITAQNDDKKENKEATGWLRSILKMLGGADFVNSAHLSAMEYGRAYLVPTGSDREDGLPGVQLVPGRDMVHAVDPYTGEITEALRVYGRNRTSRAWYRPEATYYLEPGAGPNEPSTSAVPDGFVVVNKVDTVDGQIAVFPLICRDEVTNPWGRPEAKDAFKLQDAACRMATDLSIASATMAVQQRILMGVEEEDFAPKDENGDRLLDSNGNPVPGPTASELYMSRVLTISDPMAKIAEFTAAQLQNFTTGLNSITRQAAATLGIPQSVFGVASDANPASGDAQRQDDARMIRRAEQLTRGFEPGWLGLWTYLAHVGGFSNVTVVIRWVDPALPNLASRADAVLKLATIRTEDGRPLYDWRELREMLGDSDEAIDAAQERWETEGIKRLIQNPPQPTNPNPDRPPFLGGTAR